MSLVPDLDGYQTDQSNPSLLLEPKLTKPTKELTDTDPSVTFEAQK
ncbi:MULTISPECIES: hypothetical protein [unclassified Sphingobacterium]|nr:MULTISPECIES: hypothetical protein [unclassified Sphingobacterium]